METTHTEFLKENKVSDKYAKELTELAEKNGYSSVRFFIAPDQNVSAESVIADAKSFFADIATGQGVELMFHTK
jgi:hypothetical protein